MVLYFTNFFNATLLGHSKINLKYSLNIDVFHIQYYGIYYFLKYRIIVTFFLNNKRNTLFYGMKVIKKLSFCHRKLRKRIRIPKTINIEDTNTNKHRVNISEIREKYTLWKEIFAGF